MLKKEEYDVNEEKKQVLKMLAEGKVTVDDAMKLLDAVDAGKPAIGGLPTPGKAGRMLRVRIEDEGKTKVNVNLPLSLAKVALKFIPKDARKELLDQDINIDEIISSITESTIGKIVDIQDEGNNTKVEVFVE